MQNFEVQADGLIGCSHNYAGLSFGNVASESNEGAVSKPKQAALQGLEKMRYVAGLGLKQIILPPPMRPNFALAKRFGLDLLDLPKHLTHVQAEVVRACWSASTMWAANAATISPELNAGNGKLNITIANLASSLHRQQEAAERYELLKTIFAPVEGVQVNEALPACTAFTDEGAANHMLLCPNYNEAGVEIFVYGRADGVEAPRRYPARQTLKAFQAISEMHHLPNERKIFVQQHPQAIDAGVFHNDVIAMSNQNILIYHELSFANETAFLQELQQKTKFDLNIIRLSKAELPISDAVKSYFYNSQLLSLPNGEMCVVAPIEAKENAYAHTAFEKIVASEANNIKAVYYLDVRESMKNGGGPACLRLRIIMKQAQFEAIPASFKFNETNYDKISEFVTKHYPDEISPEMLINCKFIQEINNNSIKLLELFCINV
jgi:succinylarginine dihydrolase